MPVAPFEPRYMKVGILTAALQELTPRDKRDPDPDLAIEEWAAFAREVGADYMQVSAALHPSVGDIPEEAMLDPVANTLDLREPFNKDRAKRVQKALAAHREFLEEAAKRDHRRLGKELDLFSLHEDVGGGLVLWHPKGAMVRRVIEDFSRDQHDERGYQFVYTPHVGRAKLWQTSGHLDFFKESMYPGMELEGETYYAKPMNCPFHVKIFSSRRRSYRELPLRMAEFGTVYRFERSGVLHGLFRARGFTQDDSHIFCTAE